MLSSSKFETPVIINSCYNGLEYSNICNMTDCNQNCITAYHNRCYPKKITAVCYGSYYFEMLFVVTAITSFMVTVVPGKFVAAKIIYKLFLYKQFFGHAHGRQLFFGQAVTKAQRAAAETRKETKS